jgi:hypothetical protein
MIQWGGDLGNEVVIYRRTTANGFIQIGAGPGPTSDLLPHTFKVLTWQVSGVQYFATYIDGVAYTTANTTTIFTTGYHGICSRDTAGTLYVDPNSFSITQGSDAYEETHAAYRGNFDSSGNLKSSTAFVAKLPNSIPNMLCDISMQYSSTTTQIKIWIADAIGTGLPSWTPPNGGAIIAPPSAACGSSTSPLYTSPNTLSSSTNYFFVVYYNVVSQTFSATMYSGTPPTDAQQAAAYADGTILAVVSSASTGSAIKPTGGSGGVPGGGGKQRL